MRLRSNGKYSKIQKCECGKRVNPLMEIGDEPDDWLWPECQECGEVVCQECQCDHNDEIYCPTCYGGIAIMEIMEVRKC